MVVWGGVWWGVGIGEETAGERKRRRRCSRKEQAWEEYETAAINQI